MEHKGRTVKSQVLLQQHDIIFPLKHQIKTSNSQKLRIEFNKTKSYKKGFLIFFFWAKKKKEKKTEYKVYSYSCSF